MEYLLKFLPKRFRDCFRSTFFDFNNLNEIKIRVNKPIIVIFNGLEKYLYIKGITSDIKQALIGEKEDINQMLEYISSYSLYAYEEQIKNGFITITGGHRLGIGGSIVIENNHISSIKNISFLNFRVAHEIRGCANKVFSYVFNGNKLNNLLIVSPPGFGKTTLLRDLIRQISNDNTLFNGKSISVIDERGEIAACYNGIPQNDLGIRTDVLDNCPKKDGMLLSIRSLNPSIIAVDEIGTQDDCIAIYNAINCGCKIIGTIHGCSLEEIKTKPYVGQLVEEKIFNKIIIIEERGKYICL